ncbi:uncharacterized protein LOC129576061 [Sitodiplosis mosellana]|uniref:uncharacterized protein LOC129576061 n=1 Tax=Sitodiplosis mosellana TaxID=263140 RepID=UPI002444BAD4|nr:uncharacterized protein LOC129576061 [Sitodiplosis mosellana]
MNEQETKVVVPKLSKLSLKDETDRTQSSIAGASNEQPSPKIFKLDIDCLDELFEYLSLQDLDSFAKTCKAMHKVAGEYFKRNYSGARIHIKENAAPELIGIGGRRSHKSSTFNQFVPNINFKGCPESLKHYTFEPSDFGAINRLILEGKLLTEQMIDTLNVIFPKLETIQIIVSDIYVDIYDTILKRCSNLKCFELYRLRYEPRHEFPEPESWMCHKYPQLEYLCLFPIPTIDNLMLIFQNNPNIHSFLITAEYIWEHQHELINFKVQLDLLKVIMLRNISSAPFFKLLNQLYEQKCYKRLHIIVTASDNQVTADDSFSAGFASLCGLEQLDFKNGNDLLLLSDLPNLKELIVYGENNSFEPKLIPKKFPNLQRLYIHIANDEHILSIIQGLPKLQMLELNYDLDKKMTILKLPALNTERQKVANAQKVTICVPDEVFLRMKWSCGNGDTNLQMIEMKRLASYNDRSEIFH